MQGVITKTLGFALFFTGLSLFLRKPLMRWYDSNVGELNPTLVARLTVLTGAVLGVLVTLSSVGAGAIGVMALVMLYPKMPAQRIVGSDIAHAVPLTLLAGIGHSVLGTINWHILVSPALRLVAGDRGGERGVGAHLRYRRARGAGVVLLLVVARFWFSKSRRFATLASVKPILHFISAVRSNLLKKANDSSWLSIC